MPYKDKEYRNAHVREYQRGNKEKIKERKKKYNQEHLKEAKKYRKENAERISQNRKQWCKNHPEKIRQQKIKYYENHSESIKKANKKYREKNKGRLKEVEKRRIMKKRYGLSHDDWLKMWEDQNGKCSICGESFVNPNDAFVDHNHDTNKVRGLLCRNCNFAIGLFKDNPELTIKATEYLLKNHKKR